MIRDQKPFFWKMSRHLKTHDKGNTFRTITKTLREELGYDIHHKIIDAKRLVPQHRERIYIAGFDNPTDFEFPIMPDKKAKIRDLLESRPDKKYTLSNHLWGYLQKYAEKHRLRGNGFGFGLVNLDSSYKDFECKIF